MASQHQNQPPAFDFDAADRQLDHRHVHDLQHLTTPLLEGASMQRSYNATYIVEANAGRIVLKTQHAISGFHAGFNLMEFSGDRPASSTASLEVTAEEHEKTGYNDTFGFGVSENKEVLTWISRRGKNKAMLSDAVVEPFGTCNILLTEVQLGLKKNDLLLRAPLLQARVVALSNAAAKREKTLSKDPQLNPVMADKVTDIAKLAEPLDVISRVVRDPDNYSRDYLKIQRFKRPEVQSWQAVEELTLRREGTSYALDIFADGSARHSTLSTMALDSALASRPMLRAPEALPGELARFARALVDAES